MYDHLTEMTQEEMEPPQQISRCVVRLTTSCWHDRNGIYERKTLRFMKRLCVDFNILKEDADDNGAPEILPRILNLSTCADGLYQVETCNESRDYETGYIDDYEYRLVPFPLDTTEAAVTAQQALDTAAAGGREETI